MKKETWKTVILKPGDKVAFISPGYWMPQEAVVQAAETIRSWGLEPVIGQHSNSLNVSAFAGTADERAVDLIESLKDDSIRYDLQFGSVEQMLIPHLRGRDIPVCCGFPVGGNDSVPLIEGAPSVLDVTPEGGSLTFKMEGKVEPREIGVNKNLFREENL